VASQVRLLGPADLALLLAAHPDVFDAAPLALYAGAGGVRTGTDLVMFTFDLGPGAGS
jgi:hypothetical protein